MARASASTREISTENPLLKQVREYKRLKDQIDTATKAQKLIRDELMTVIDQQGEADDQGHLWFELDTEIDGVTKLLRQRKVSRSINQEAAEEILAAAGLLDECTEMVRVVNEDALMKALFDELLTEEQVDEMYPAKITWALYLK